MVAAHPLPLPSVDEVMRRVCAGELSFEEVLEQRLLGYSREEWERLSPTEQLHASGFPDDEVVFGGTADECKAWLRAGEAQACAPSG